MYLSHKLRFNTDAESKKLTVMPWFTQLGWDLCSEPHGDLIQFLPMTPWDKDCFYLHFTEEGIGINKG